jgi:hypothetical protein
LISGTTEKADEGTVVEVCALLCLVFRLTKTDIDTDMLDTEQAPTQVDSQPDRQMDR